MFALKYLSPITICSLSLAIMLILLMIDGASASYNIYLTKQNLLKLLPEATSKEIRTNFKIFLTKAKLRQVPLAKKRSERVLSKLYKEERLLKEQIAELERNLGIVDSNMKRNSLRVIEVQDNKRKDEEGAGGANRPKLKLTELTESKIQDWKDELKRKQLEYQETRAKIEEAKNIIKNPENYISIPTNYGRRDPEEVRNLERAVLINDRENMEFRSQIVSGEIVPAWMEDSW